MVCNVNVYIKIWYRMSQGTPYTSAPPAKSDIHRGMWYIIIIIIMQPNRFIIIHEGVVKRFVI